MPSEIGLIVTHLRKLLQLLDATVSAPAPGPPRVVIDVPEDTDPRSATAYIKRMSGETHDQWLFRCGLIDETKGKAVIMRKPHVVRRLPRKPSWAID